jgi:hypothetical protein
MLRRINRFICGLSGHTPLLHFENGRMTLQCDSCGYETPGWDLRPTPRVEEEAGPEAMLVSRRGVLALLFVLAAVAPGWAQTREAYLEVFPPVSIQCTGTGASVKCIRPSLVQPDPKVAAAVLQNPKLESNVTLVRFGVETGRSGSTSSTGPTAGPWDFPPERPARRLDGTLLTDPVQTYGAVPYLLLVVPR